MSVAKSDYEYLAVVLSLLVALVIAMMLPTFSRNAQVKLPAWAPIGGKQLVVDPRVDPKAHARAAREAEIRERFTQGAFMLHAKRYDEAVTVLHRVLELAPRLTEAHSNLGYALLGLGEHKAAADFFNSALAIDPYFSQAYYGLAMALEAREDYEGALGAMRSYIHLSKPDNPYLTKARSALWEWEQKLGRVPGSAGVPAGSGAGKKKG